MGFKSCAKGENGLIQGTESLAEWKEGSGEDFSKSPGKLCSADFECKDKSAYRGLRNPREGDEQTANRKAAGPNRPLKRLGRPIKAGRGC